MVLWNQNGAQILKSSSDGLIQEPQVVKVRRSAGFLVNRQI